ncbi:MAG: PD-(D/E)XK nuclease family protein [Anaerolineae bacterium]|nr:PD-(D/E)XK nuclease family protein [Anaerolineae bacterium]
MPTTILQATVGAGKTEAALERLSSLLHDRQRPFAKAWILLATKRQEVGFRQRLVDLKEHVVYFNAEFFNFYEVNARILNLAGIPQRRIQESARFALIRKILQDMLDEGKLETFKPIAKISGFLRVIADLIYELKQNRVVPAVYQRAAMTQKDRELAEIYAIYQDLMHKHHLVDIEGEGWLALATVEAQENLASHVDLLLVDGYDQFTPVQAAMLAALSKQVKEVVITLTKAPGDNQDDPQNQIGLRFERAYERLMESHRQIGAEIFRRLEPEPVVPKHTDLLTLCQTIFSGDEPVMMQGAILMLEAPELIQEVAAVLREVKRLMLEGVRPDDILIALRDWSRYHTFFDIYARLYDLPLLLHRGAAIAQNPAITVLMNLLALPGKNPDANTAFRRRDLLDVLRSPYVIVPGFDADTIDLLERVSRDKQVLGGRQNWMDAIQAAATGYYDEENDEDVEPLLTAQQESDLSIALEDFFVHIIAQRSDTLLTYVTWLENLIGQDTLENPDDEPDEPQPNAPYTLNMPRCIRAIAGDDDMERIIVRDVEALNVFKDFLRGMLSTQEFLRTALGDRPSIVDWTTFYDDLQSGVKNATVKQRNPIRSGRVLVTTATEARGLPHDHVFILGLSEGIFPAEIPEDPIYLDSERANLKQAGVFLETVAERADDNGIFYELISLPRQSLTLSRPTIREGKSWVESHLWRMTQAVFSNLVPRRYGIGEVVPTHEVTSLDEVFLAVANGFEQDGLAEDKQVIYAWLQSDDSVFPYWNNIGHGRATETRRLSRKPHDEYSGQIRHPDLLEFAQEQVGKRRIWSASQLNEYATCPYRFFAHRLLRLDALKEPEEGMNALQLGSVNHAILEATYGELARGSYAIVPEHLDEALGTLHEKAQAIFNRAPQDYGFRPTVLWREEQSVILQQLEQLIRADFSAESPLNKFGSPRMPFKLELKFGLGDSQPALIGIEDKIMRVRGAIDRIDRVGDKLIVIDYKTGTTKIESKEIAAGRNFQMMVYLLALEYIITQNKWHYEVAGGAFWHIRNQEVSGLLQVDSAIEDNEAIEAGMQHLSRYLDNMQQGYFAEQPPKIEKGKCVSYCDFYQLCRLANTQQYKRD